MYIVNNEIGIKDLVFNSKKIHSIDPSKIA